MSTGAGMQLKVGDSGEQVLELQQLLVTHGLLTESSVTGVYDEVTAHAVRAFQHGHRPRIPETGAVDDVTWKAVHHTRPALLIVGSTGDDVVVLQHRLNIDTASLEDGAYAPLLEDGIFGPRTDTRLREVQSLRGLTVDGICGPKTWSSFEAHERITVRAAQVPAALSRPEPPAEAPVDASNIDIANIAARTVRATADEAPDATQRTAAPGRRAGSVICRTCGSTNNASDDFCANCGAFLSSVGAKVAPPMPHAPAPDPAPERRPEPQPPAPQAPTAQATTSPVSRNYDQLLSDALKRIVKPGRIVFNPPSAMRLDETARVEVRVTRSTELDRKLNANLKGRGSPQFETIETSVFMGVTLRGAGFEVTPYSDEEQAVTDDDVTTWEFDVRALHRGQQALVLSASMRIPVDGQPDQRRSVPVLERRINVDVTTMELVRGFVTRNWQWCVGTTVGLGGALGAW